MNRGAIVADGEPGELIRNAKVEESVTLDLQGFLRVGGGAEEV